jgi:hypothetical protein
MQHISKLLLYLHLNFIETMQEKDPILRERELDGYRSIAQKIRNRLQQLENANDKDKRRWVWELLQNAIDAGNKTPIDVTIEIDNTSLKFQHNGGYFLPRSVTNLVHQISSKEGTDSIGRFGTGFLTTHTLSRKVEVESVYENNDKFYPFKLVMDRSGTTERELVLGIEKTWDLYRNSMQEGSSVKPEPTTTFKYVEPNLGIAENTLRDAMDFIPYCFAFVSHLNTFSVKNEIRNTHTTYKRKPEVKINENLSILSFEKTTGQQTEEIQLLYITNGSISLAIGVQNIDNRTVVLPISPNTPRIFCAYPLIGTEDFYFPFVLNSDNFSPRTERDKLYLKGETPDAINNKGLLKQSLGLYQIALAYMSQHQWKEIWRIIPNLLPPRDDDFDRDWYAMAIDTGIKKILLNNKIVENEAGELKYIVGDEFCYFPNHEKEEIRNRIWQFGYDLMPQQLPAKKHLNQWYEITKEWEECESLTLEKLVNKVSNYSRLNNLAAALQKTEEGTSEWINDFVGFIDKEQSFLLEKYPILPNQYGNFCKKSDLYEEKEKVEDILKDILLQLGEDWKKEYLNTAITKANFGNKVRWRHNIIQAINGVIDKNDSPATIKLKGVSVRKAISMLVSLYNKEDDAYRKDLFDIVKAFDKTVGDRIHITDLLPNETWVKADKWLLQAIVADILYCKDLATLAQSLELSIEESLTLLDKLFAFLLANEKLELLSEKAVYPNQEGSFRLKSELFDGEYLPEPLKLILKDLEILTRPTQEHKGWEHILLHKSITAFRQKHKLQVKTVKDLSLLINELLRNIPKDTNKQHLNLILRLLAIGNTFNEKQKIIWEFSRALYGDDSPEKIELLNTTDLDTSTCLDWILTRIVIDIESNQFVETLQKELFGNVEALEWLNRVIDFIQRSEVWKHLLDDYAIIPNQNEDLCKLPILYEDKNIPTELKEIIKSFNYDWIGELKHQVIDVSHLSIRPRTKNDAAYEINAYFKGYDGSREDPKFVGRWKNLRKYLRNEEKEYKETHFDWVHRHEAEITVATLGSEEQKDNILQIIESGNASYFNKLVEGGFSKNDLKELAENPQEFKEFKTWKETGSKVMSDDNILEVLNGKLNTKYDSLKTLLKMLKKADEKESPKINFAQLPPPSVIDEAVIAKSNEEAKEQLYDYLGTQDAQEKGYDRGAWNQQFDTIITGVKRYGLDIKIVIKGAKNGTVYFDTAKKEQKALKESFSELWVFDGNALFEITVGNMIDVWNMVGMKTYMFDFTKS